jgi:hypothetical protein
MPKLIALLLSLSCTAISFANEPVEIVKPAEVKWTLLFNGQNLDGWKVPKFGGDGEVVVEDKKLIINAGNPITGITLENKDKKLPQINYEIVAEAARLEGGDFFYCLTFPVKDSFCSLVLGGWGGTVTGLSSINSYDASENETTGVMTFESNKFYKVTLRVMDNRIQALVDDDIIVNVDTTDKKISTRIEVDDCKPLGLSTYNTKAGIKSFKYRLLTEKEMTNFKTKHPVTD